MNKDINQLRRERLIEIYNKEFYEEYYTIVTNIRSVSMGNTSFSNSWKEWLGIGAISASVIAVNAIFGILVAVGILSGFVTLGVGIIAAVAGLVGGIIFQRYRNNVSREKYQAAEGFIEREITPENLEAFKQQLLKQLYPALIDCTPGQINTMVKVVMEALANLIINKQISSFSEINTHHMDKLLMLSMEKTPSVRLNTKMILSIVAKMTKASDSSQLEVSTSLSSDTDCHLAGNASLSGQSFWEHPSEVTVSCDGREKDVLSASPVKPM